MQRWRQEVNIPPHGRAAHHDARVLLPQVTLIRSGKGIDIKMETRGWDEGAQATRGQRSKEGLADYRYFPEPDLPPLAISEEYLSKVKVTSGHKESTCGTSNR